MITVELCGKNHLVFPYYTYLYVLHGGTDIFVLYTRVRVCKPFRSPEIDSQPGGIYSSESIFVYNYGLGQTAEGIYVDHFANIVANTVSVFFKLTKGNHNLGRLGLYICCGTCTN